MGPSFLLVALRIIRSPELGADTIIWLGGAGDAIETTRLSGMIVGRSPATYLIGADADNPLGRTAWPVVTAATTKWISASWRSCGCAPPG